MTDVFETPAVEDKPKRARGRTTANITAKQAENLRTDTDTRIKFKRDQPRVMGGDVELNLDVPAGTVPAGYRGLWVEDNGQGAVEKALAEWYGHVTDADGVNISRPSGSKKMFLMAIENELHEENEKLRLQKYYASINEDDGKSLGVEGLDSYTPNGANPKMKVTTDPFAS